MVLRKIAAGLLLLLASGTLLPAQTIWSGTAVADAFVTTGSDGSLSGNNYGAAGALLIAPAALPKGEFQSVMRFDVSGAVAAFDTAYGAGQWTITSVTLALGTNSGTNGGNPGNAIFNTIADGSFSIDWMQNDSWIEGDGTPMSPGASGITFDTLPGFLSGSDELVGTFFWPAGGNGVTTWTLNSEPSLISDITSGGLVGFRFYAADSEVSYLFNSRTFTTAANRPVLNITAVVPEPGAALLFLVGAGAMALRRRLGE